MGEFMIKYQTNEKMPTKLEKSKKKPKKGQFRY